MVYNYSKFDGMADNSSGNADAEKMAKASENVWDHSWSTEEIRKNSGNWTLAGDVGLLNHLKQFSHKLISRTHEMEIAIDSLVHTSKVTCAKVNNVINDFQMLSNLQFVENRVYDEEAKSPEPEPVPDQPKTKEQREAEMMPRIVQALKLGMSVLDTAFEKLDVDETSESEDEEDISQGRTILVPKDLYEHQPLPYIIGSEEFQRDDFAGLHNLYDEDISTDVSMQDENISASAESEDESEEESDFEEQDFQKRPTIITEHKETKSSIDTLQNRFSDSDGSDLFDAEEDEKEVNGYVSEPTVTEKPKENAQTSLMEELMRKTKGPTSSTIDNNRPETIQTSVPAKAVETNDSNDLFASESFLDEEDSPFRKKTGLFSSDGLFGKESKSEGSLFDDEGDDVKPVSVKKELEPKVVEKKQVLPKKEPLAAKRPKSPSLFEDDEDSEHDLFSSTPAPVPVAIKSSPQVAAHKQEKNKVLPTLPVQPEKKSVPVNKPLSAPTKKTNSDSLFDEDSDDNDLFSAAPKATTKTMSFGVLDNKEDEEDDLFSTKSSLRTQKQSPKMLDVGDVLSKSEKDSYNSLFEESDSFDIFKPSVEKLQPKAQDTEVPKVLDIGPTKKLEESVHSSLFEDSGSFDLFKPSVKKAQPKSQNIESTNVLDVGASPKIAEKDSYPSLFEESGSFDIFKPSVEKSQPKPLDIEKSKPQPKAVEPLAKQKKESSLFEESDSFDLFSAPKEADVKKPDIAIKKKPPSDALAATHKKPDPVNVTKVVVDSGSVSMGFDEPVSHSNTLSVINKDRVKIQAKRRKPTRKGRQSHISTDGGNVADDEYSSTPVKDEAEDDADAFIPPTPVMKEIDLIPETPLEQQPLSKSNSAFSKKEQSKKNLMSQLISEAAAFKIGKKPVLDMHEDDDDLFGDKIPNSKSAGADISLLSPTSSNEVLVKDSLESDGTKGGESSVLSGSTSDDDLFSGPAFNDFRSSVSDRNSIFDDDDIFKPLKKKEGSRQSVDDISIGDDDDIFANVDKEKYEMFPTQYDDDDDIFSNVEKPNQQKLPQEKKTAIKKETKKENIDSFSDPLGGLTLND